MLSFTITPSTGSDVPPREKVNRHETRELLHCGPAPLTSKFKLLPGQQRQWQIRCASLSTTLDQLNFIRLLHSSLSEHQ